MVSPDIPSNISLLAAPPLFGHLFNYGLFGVLATQVYVYSNTFAADSRYLKLYIYGLFIVECVQVGLATHDAYAVYGTGWGDLEALDSTHLLWFSIPVMSGMISASVQIFFAWRIYILSKSPYLGMFIVLIALMQGSGAMATGIMVHVLSLPDSAIQAVTSAPCTVWLGGSAACDVIIATCMLYFLSRGRQGLTTDAMLSRLMRLTVETGTLTASIACVDLILFLLFKDNNLHFAPALTLSKLYSNSLMMLFNNRTRMRTLRGGIHTGSGNRLMLSTSGPSDLESSHGEDTTGGRARPQEIALRKLPMVGYRADVGSTVDGFDDRSDSDMHKVSTP